MRLLVCGGRHFEDAEMVHHELTALHWRKPISVVVHGSIAGVGIIAEAWARRHGIAVVRYPPNWEFYGKKAEGLRSDFMLTDSRPDFVVAFPGGRHTADLVQRAINVGLAVLAIPPNTAGACPVAKHPPQRGQPTTASL
ncbi:DUF2493 domain-containing protein [Bradyrhizobium sp. AUGA SZCCT0051]|jgi:hypothetical protein|uniref:YspA cpYpsA-related SLOG domain-containing protein n=8 Tax=Pseudomonadota TaxID=1224 RepID=K8P4H5_9BRAD|nr:MULTISPECIES: DUF2493 domain-containing protein [Alphaproteobacteria]EKS37462.1 hypothetical protein HMPREF9695_03880 [Afipia broomeae ATCC 49717]MAH71786.1 DUF2493 domain-containing protein [Afipia sp.]MBD3849382.1 DUF2493 domain-containing protein [Bosea spartocytisi]MBR1090478.1 DUF2493 domain-containing protein [Bradyrhizobium manausense]MBR1205116.1 DUF2493 domain-containing protein [Bradyrhizobium sp. AUGA SZCCT0124]MBR1312202.1 DUF2493 domain-containing protein [Bradyrhizobium sp. A